MSEANKLSEERTRLAREILAKLGEYGVDYVVLRNSEELLETLGHDIDIGMKDQRSFESSLAKAGEAMSLKVAKTQKRGNYSCYFIMQSPSCCFLHLDTWTELDFRGITMVDPGRLFQGSFKERGINVASPVLQILGILLKEICYCRKLENKHIERVIRIYKTIGREKFLSEGELFIGRKITCILSDIIEDPGFQNSAGKDLSEARSRILRHCFWQNPLSSTISYLGWLKDQFLAFVKPPGLFITLFGPDGSGKSTLCKMIEEKLKDQLFNRVRYYHGHPEILPRLGIIKAKILGGPLPEDGFSDNNTDEKLSKPHNPLKGCLYVLYYTLDYFLARIPFRFHRARNDLILFDRYFYDYTMQPLWEITPRWFIKLASLFIPKPDLFFFLMADPEEIHRRKPELTTDEIASQQAQMKSLMMQLKPFVEIDTTNDPEKAVSLITNSLVEKYIQRGFGL
jgi:thymidylate kinase